MNTEELLYILALKRAAFIGDIMAKKLIRTFGSAKDVFNQSYSKIAAVEGMGDKKASFLKSAAHLLHTAEAELDFISKHKIKCRVFNQEEYPTSLKHCIDGPIVFFEKGTINYSNPYQLSIVGTRQITSNGSAFLDRFFQEIAGLKPTIISGYAYGVDIQAHQLAIKYGLQTIAVLAHGLNQTYPRTHAVYNEQMVQNGGFITDYWHTDSFDRKNFLGRNRIIAGLSEATVVVESNLKGGSLVTADLANAYNRDVFAVPGRFSDPYSSGCNELIKQSKAYMLTKAADLSYILGWNKPQLGVQQELFVELNPRERVLYEYLKSNGRQLLDLIALGVNQSVHDTASILMDMELKGVVRPLPGKIFTLA